ncbi:MAG: AmmeMemoRadiSam system radical SAM enzyme [Desulfobacteraceae bacterium]|nr:AmmeMemoRadiSam system radical SAM enzyme [Desulfobacteraceae bacterium]
MEARLYEQQDEKKVKCGLCAHRCQIKEGRRGICNVRENREGVLHTLVYDRIIARHVDPIEKKPLFHFYPSSLSYSIGTVGCNFRCRFCQNADIAHMATDHQGRIMGKSFTPEQIVEEAEITGCRSIAYTYTEPTVFFELACDAARIAHEKGIKNVFVTNGYMTEQALESIHPYLDAVNVDLKAFTEEFYKNYCSAKLEHVLSAMAKMKELGIFMEVTTLLIPGLNDDEKELKSLVSFLVSEIGDDTPWHVSRFHPTYRLTDRPSTPVETLQRARDIGLEQGLKYVYTGNVPGEATESTYCHQCGACIIARKGFTVMENRVENNRCPECNAPVNGVGLS